MARHAYTIAAIVALAVATSAAPASAMTLSCVPQDMGGWQDGSLDNTPLYSDEPAATPFTIDLETGAFARPATGDQPAERVTYEVLARGSDEPEANLDFVAFERERMVLLRIVLENDVWSFVRDYGRTLEAGTCSLEAE